MKRIISILSLLVLTFTLINLTDANAQEKNDWDLFSKNLVTALKSDHEGLRLSAMQHVITYADSIDVSEAAPAIVKIYRNHKDERVRYLALVTINKMNNDWAKGIVKRDIDFEQSKMIKKMMYAILLAKKEENRFVSIDK